MRAIAGARLLWGLPLVAALCGCAQNSVGLQSQVSSLQQQQIALSQRNTELQTRASALDKDNQELQTMLGQSQQQGRLLEDQLAAMRDQLTSATSQMAKMKQQQTPPEEKHAETWMASNKPQTTPTPPAPQAAAKITANSSLHSQLPAIEIPGIQVRPDGDVIRIELPSAKLFSPGTARLLPEAGPLLDQVAADIVRLYPEQTVGIEGHTDNDPASAGRWQNNHQLSVGEAMAVYDYLSLRSRIKATQMFVVGHGPNHPIVSNGTAPGKERNRRVELVIYPERAAAR